MLDSSKEAKCKQSRGILLETRALARRFLPSVKNVLFYNIYIFSDIQYPHIL